MNIDKVYRPDRINPFSGLLQQSTTNGVKPSISFGILKGVKPRSYGHYMWGEFKGKKIEVFDAWKHKQMLIYVSENMNFIKSKLTYWMDGIKKVMRANGK